MGVSKTARYALVEHAHRLQRPQSRTLQRYTGPRLRQFGSDFDNLASYSRALKRHAERHPAHASADDQHVFRGAHPIAPDWSRHHRTREGLRHVRRGIGCPFRSKADITSTSMTSVIDPKRTLHSGLLSRSGAPLVHEGQRFWAAHVAGLQSVKLETAVFDQLLDWSVEVTTTANTFPSRS